MRTTVRSNLSNTDDCIIVHYFKLSNHIESFSCKKEDVEMHKKEFPSSVWKLKLNKNSIKYDFNQ